MPALRFCRRVKDQNSYVDLALDVIENDTNGGAHTSYGSNRGEWIQRYDENNKSTNSLAREFIPLFDCWVPNQVLVTTRDGRSPVRMRPSPSAALITECS